MKIKYKNYIIKEKKGRCIVWPEEKTALGKLLFCLSVQEKQILHKHLLQFINSVYCTWGFDLQV